MSSEPKNIVEVSAEIAIALIQPECPSITLTHSPVAVYQILIVLSDEPENIVKASPEIAIELTEPECPSRTLTHSPVAVC